MSVKSTKKKFNKLYKYCIFNNLKFYVILYATSYKTRKPAKAGFPKISLHGS